MLMNYSAELLVNTVKIVSFGGLPYMLEVRYKDVWMNKPMTPISHLKSKFIPVTKQVCV